MLNAWHINNLLWKRRPTTANRKPATTSTSDPGVCAVPKTATLQKTFRSGDTTSCSTAENVSKTFGQLSGTKLLGHPHCDSAFKNSHGDTPSCNTAEKVSRKCLFCSDAEDAMLTCCVLPCIFSEQELAVSDDEGDARFISSGFWTTCGTAHRMVADFCSHVARRIFVISIHFGFLIC